MPKIFFNYEIRNRKKSVWMYYSESISSMYVYIVYYCWTKLQLLLFLNRKIEGMPKFIKICDLLLRAENFNGRGQIMQYF